MKEITANREYTLTSGSKMKSTACRMNIVENTHLRPMASENHA